MPTGPLHLQQLDPVSDRGADLDRATEGLLRWDLHRLAGLRVRASAGLAEPGVTVASGSSWPLCLDVPAGSC